MSSAEGPTEHSSAPLNWARWFLVIGLVFGLSFATLIRPMKGMDELLHAMRVDTMSQGWLVPPLHRASPADYQVRGCTEAYLVKVLVEPDFPWYRNPKCVKAEDARQFGNSIARAEYWSPVPYVPAVVGYRLGMAVHGAAGAFLFARIFQVLAFVALLYAAIRITPWGKPLLFTIGLLPVVLGGAAGISADPMSIGFTILGLCMILRLIARATQHEPHVASRRDLVTLAVVLACAGLSKSVYAPFALLVLAIPTTGFGTLRRRVVTACLIIGSVAVTAGAWVVGVTLRVAPTDGNSVSSPAAAHAIQHHPFTFASAILRTWIDPTETRHVIGGLIVPVYRLGGGPDIAIWLLIVACIGLVYLRLVDPRPHFRRTVTGEDDPGSDRRRHNRIGAALLAAGVGLVSFLTIEYGIATTDPLNWPRLITGVQGRYLVPLIPLTLFGVNVRRYVPPIRRLVGWVPFAMVAMLSWWLIVELRHSNHWLT